MTDYLTCWCCRSSHDLVGNCACTRDECPRGEQCQKKR